MFLVEINEKPISTMTSTKTGFTTGNLPAFQASPTCGSADLSTHEAKAMQTKHISDCLRGTRDAPRAAGQDRQGQNTLSQVRSTAWRAGILYKVD